MLSKFFRDENENLVPVASAYGGRYSYPRSPATDDGWALVFMLTSPQQIAAARQDPRVVVCPLAFDNSAAPDEVISTYASWGVTAEMSMGSVLARLSETEPIFAQVG